MTTLSNLINIIGPCVAAILAGLAISSCNSAEPTDSNEPIIAEVDGTKFEIPRDDVKHAFVGPDQILLVRIAPSSRKFHIVLDEWVLPLKHLEPDIPRVSRLNEITGDYQVFDYPFGKVVCTDRRPRYNCGFSFPESFATWSVLFNRAELENVEDIHRDAIEIIDGYRRSDPA